MKNILIIGMLFVSFGMFGQIGGGFVQTGGGGTSSTAVNTLIDAKLLSLGVDTIIDYNNKAEIYFSRMPYPLSNYEKQLFSQLMDSIDHYYPDSVDVIYDFTHPYIEQCLLNAQKATYDPYLNGTVTFTGGVGFTGTGTGASTISTGFPDNNLAGDKYAIDKASVSIYNRSNVLTDSKSLFGWYAATERVEITIRTSNFQFAMHSASTTTVAHNNNIRGLLTVSYSNGSHYIFQNGVKLASAAKTAVLPTGTIHLLNSNQLNQLSANQVSFLVIGKFVNPSKLNTIIERYMDAKGIGVE